MRGAKQNKNNLSKTNLKGKEKRKNKKKSSTPMIGDSSKKNDELTSDLIIGEMSNLNTDNPNLQSRHTEELEQAKTFWLFGKWEQLVAMDSEKIPQHSNRKELALLLATAYQQLGQHKNASNYINLALKWGCDKRLAAKFLIAGVYNTLGCAYILKQNKKKTNSCFQESVKIGVKKGELKVISQSRTVQEVTKRGLLPDLANLIGDSLNAIKHNNYRPGEMKSKIKILETEIGLLNQELTLAQQRLQIYPHKEINTGTNASTAFSSNVNDFSSKVEDIERLSVSQLGQDIWVLKKTNYKKGGFFVEFGASNGVLLSNTYLLEKYFNWQGICSEPNPKFYTQLKQNRSCKVTNQYIGRKTGEEIEFILADAYGGSSEFSGDDHHKDIRQAYRDAGQTKTITSISLDDFLMQHKAPRNIDYISIDTEGSEYEVLSTFSFDEWDVRLFTIEHNFTSQRAKIRILLETNGYICTEHQWDDWYEKLV